MVCLCVCVCVCVCVWREKEGGGLTIVIIEHHLGGGGEDQLWQSDCNSFRNVHANPLFQIKSASFLLLTLTSFPKANTHSCLL